jgi:hypothetical protein
MQQSEALSFLKRDLQIITSQLELGDYPQLFEQELQEYFPFNEQTLDWLSEIYQSEKYEAFDANKLSLYYEQKHPFLFIRDLAHMNSWNQGYQQHSQRRDHITGLLFAGNSQMALEATFCLCRPTRINEPTGTWFDFKQVMENLDHVDESFYNQQALKAGALFYLYFHLSDSSHLIVTQDLVELVSPYREAIERCQLHGSAALKRECELMSQLFRPDQVNRTLLDSL